MLAAKTNVHASLRSIRAFYIRLQASLPPSVLAHCLTSRTLVCESENVEGGASFSGNCMAWRGERACHNLFVPAKGKGSHGKVYFGTAATIVKDRKKELGTGLLHQMCKDLGIKPEDL
jgi:hypothetical protein